MPGFTRENFKPNPCIDLDHFNSEQSTVDFLANTLHTECTYYLT